MILDSNLKINATYTPSRTVHDIPQVIPVGNHKVTNVGHLLELNSVRTINERVEFLFGGAFEYTDTRFFPSTSLDNHWHEVYGQLDFQWLSWLKIVSGLRINKAKRFDADVSPRVGLILDFESGFGAKILYGKAFRSANALETTIFRVHDVDSNDVEREVLNTIDLQLYYNDPIIQSSLTFYHSEGERPPSIINLPGGAGTELVVEPDVTYHGLEWETKLRLSEQLYGVANMSYQDNDNTARTDIENRFPNWMAKIGISYDSGNVFSSSLFYSFIDEVKPIEDVVPDQLTVNNLASSYHLLTANLTLRIGKMFRQALFENSIVTIYADNLLDEDIYFPGQPENFNFPIHDRRSITVTFRHMF